jgi:hypothetical protein
MAKVLFVVTGASYWTLKDGTRHPTGYWAEEFAAPYSQVIGAGHEIVVATPGGVVPYVDVMSLRPSMAGSEQIALEQEDILRSAEECAGRSSWRTPALTTTTPSTIPAATVRWRICGTTPTRAGC